jgi:hypothetical protein
MPKLHGKIIEQNFLDRKKKKELCAWIFWLSKPNPCAT